jgi:peptidoglycan/xylan/chitin deacetylase (PgdA/CDA1 family)
MYHNVPGAGAELAGVGSSTTSYFVDKDRFADQLKEIISYGGWFLSIKQVEDFFTGPPAETGATWPAGYPVLLTFDDGWRDSVEVAGPILQAHSCQAFLFVTTQFVGQPLFVDRRLLANLPRDQFCLGSHARTHRLLSLLSDVEIRAELRDSKSFLEDIGGHPVDALSIPGGAVDDRVRRIAGETGYRLMFTSEIHCNSRATGPLAIGRLAIKRRTSSASLRRFVRQQIAREWMRRSILAGPKQLLGLGRYQRIRSYLLGQSQSHP